MLVTLVHPRVQFDFGAIKLLKGELESLGIKRPLFITDKGLVQAGVFATVQRAMGNANSLAVFDEVPENPTYDGVMRAVAAYQANHCDGIVAVGGGSVIDTAKAVSVVATQGGHISDYVGRLDKIKSHTAPLVAVPTTAGTGSEATRGAGLHPDGKSRGHGISSTYIVPKVAICDPELTFSLSPRLRQEPAWTRSGMRSRTSSPKRAIRWAMPSRSMPARGCSPISSTQRRAATKRRAGT